MALQLTKACLSSYSQNGVEDNIAVRGGEEKDIRAFP